MYRNPNTRITPNLFVGNSYRNYAYSEREWLLKGPKDMSIFMEVLKSFKEKIQIGF